MWKRWKGLVLAALLATLPGMPGRADPLPRNGFRAGVAWDHLQRTDGGPTDGAGAVVGYRRALADDWDAWVQIGGSVLPRRARAAADLLAASGGVSLVLDASMFRPEVFVGVGFLGSVASDDLPPNGMALVGAALDVRLVPAIWLGLRGEYRIPFLRRSRVGSASSLGLQVQIPF